MYMCGVTLWNVCRHSWSLKTTTTSENLIETVNSQNGLTISLGLTSAFIQGYSRKHHSQGNNNWRRVLRTNNFDIYFNLAWNIIFRANATFIMVKINHTSYFTAEDHRIQIGCPHVHYVYGCYVTMVTCGPSDMYDIKKRHSRTPWPQVSNDGGFKPVLQHRVSGCIFIRCKVLDVRWFPILHVHEIYFEG